MRYLSQCSQFYREFRRTFGTTGSILPSSPNLARAMVWALRRPRRGPIRVLEVGAGTGAVTAEIMRHLEPSDRLDIVEINGQFIDVLRRRFAAEPLFQAHDEQTCLIHAPLQEVIGEHVYDFMISGLPLNNFPISLVRDIFHSYQRLLKPGGLLSYFEYLAIRGLKSAFVSPSERRRLRVLSRFLQRRIRAWQVHEQWIFMNVPPAVARHLCFPR
jgi:phosphatidylethanolamine/phosphatidyl-N-methylethanolamine N-methyltransferase